MFFLLAFIIPQISWGEGKKSFPTSIKLVCIYEDYNLKVDKSIYADISGKPLLSRLLGEFSESKILVHSLGKDSKKSPCDNCFENYPRTIYECALMPIVFDEKFLSGQRFVKVKFEGKWAWIKVPAEVSLYELTPEEISCYQERKKTLLAPSKLPEQLSLKTGIPRIITDNYSVIDGSWSRRLHLNESGILKVSLVNGSTPPTFAIALESNVESGSEILNGIYQTIQPGENFEIFLTSGNYRVRLEEGGREEDYSPSCPSAKQALRLELSKSPSAPKLSDNLATLRSKQSLAINSQPTQYNLLLTLLVPAITFSYEFKAISLISIEQVKLPENIDFRIDYGSSDTVDIKNDRQKILTGAGTFTISIQADDSENWKPTDVVPVSFVISTKVGNLSDRLFEPTFARGSSFPGPVVQFRNISGLDFNAVEVEFNYRQMESYYKGIQTVSTWKAGELHDFEFPSEKDKPLSTESLKLEIKSIDGSNEIDFALSSPKYPTMDAVEYWIPSSEYDEQIKLKVWEYCAKVDPHSGKAFETCQNKWIRQEFVCRRTVDPRSSEFIACVRKSIAKNFPELLSHLGK